jgi:hypothetical protein
MWLDGATLNWTLWLSMPLWTPTARTSSSPVSTSVIGDHLAVPFQTTVLGVEVTVTKIDLLSGSGIVAICSRAKHRQAIGILDLPLPAPPPAGAEWIDAYRHWAT